MSDIKLTTEITSENPVLHDIYLENGQMVLTEGTQEVAAQDIRIRLQFFQGEWFLDQREGFPIFQKVLVKAPDLSQIQGLYRKAILETPGISRVSNVRLEFTRALREGTLTFTAITDGGQTIDFDEPFIVTPE